MIPKVEDILVAGLERRICEILGDVVAGTDNEPETFVTTFETRRFTPFRQEETSITIFGEVNAELSVVFYSQKQRIDYSPLYASIASNPFIDLGAGISAFIEIDHCEAAEGPYLSNDAWLIKASYYVFEVDDATGYQPPIIAAAATSEYDVYPTPQPYQPNEPEVHFSR